MSAPALKVPQEEHGPGGLADVDEATGAGQPVSEAADVDVAVAVDLRHPQKRLVEAPAVVEVELIGLVDDRLGTGHGAEAEPAAGGQAADRAGFDGERDQVEDALLARHGGDPLWNPDAQVHDRVRLEQHRRAAGDHLALVERRRPR